MVQNTIAFIIVFAALFALTVGFMAAVDALPEPIGGVKAPVETPVEREPAQVQTVEAPMRVVAKAVGVDATVENPASTEIAVLDEALLRGAVRYPTSAMLGTNGTVLLFGHSTSLPVVRNQAYKTFDGIQKLKDGEIISVYSGATEYRYAVTGVRLANAEEDVVELPTNGKFLTLVTCNTSFANKSSRYVVTAELVGSYAL